MKARIFVRDLSEEEQQSLSAGLRSSDAFVLRRSQILLASARGEIAPRIANALSCDEQTVRHAIHAFNQAGRSALQAGSSRPHHLATVLRADVTAEMLKTVLHRPPRDFGFQTSLWTLELARQAVCASRVDGTPSQHRDHAPNAQPSGDQLEAGQALDHQCAPRRCI